MPQNYVGNDFLGDIFMILKCVGGHMDGAVFVLSRNTTIHPDGLWFNGQDEHGRTVQHQYKFDKSDDDNRALAYKYEGPVVDTGIEFETGE